MEVIIIRGDSRNVAVINKKGEKRFYKPAEGATKEEIERAVFEAKKRGAEIRYYYLPQISFEIIETHVPPGYEQPWHSHKKINEAMLGLNGEVVVLVENEEFTIKAGDFIVLDRGRDHTQKNTTKNYAVTLTFKFLGPDEKDIELFKSDWYGR